MIDVVFQRGRGSRSWWLPSSRVQAIRPFRPTYPKSSIFIFLPSLPPPFKKPSKLSRWGSTACASCIPASPLLLPLPRARVNQPTMKLKASKRARRKKRTGKKQKKEENKTVKRVFMYGKRKRRSLGGGVVRDRSSSLLGRKRPHASSLFLTFPLSFHALQKICPCPGL